MKAIIITGSRKWPRSNYAPILALLAELDASIIIHGHCDQGVDAIVHSQCEGEGCFHLPMPAQWEKHGKRAGPMRNAAMLRVLLALGETGYDIAVYAFPAPVSKGTRHMMGIAVAAGVMVHDYGDHWGKPEHDLESIGA